MVKLDLYGTVYSSTSRATEYFLEVILRGESHPTTISRRGGVPSDVGIRGDTPVKGIKTTQINITIYMLSIFRSLLLQ